MKLVISKNANTNYLARLVWIQSFHPHPDPDVQRMKCASVGNYNIIVGIDETPQMFVYFPTSSKINPELLAFANLYRHSDKNADNTKTGLFEDNGRVKAVKLRGCVSEGFLLPFTIFASWIAKETQIELEQDQISDGLEFDSVEHTGKTFWVCKKFIPQAGYKHHGGSNNSKRKDCYKVIPEQFPEHYETVQIKKLSKPIEPEDYIHISGKIHGTSLRCGYVVCREKPKFFRNIAHLLVGMKWNSPKYYYDYLFGSRHVVKSEDSNSGYYKSEPYKYAFHTIQPALQAGMNVYAEIVGYNPDGSYIQKGYDYGCVPPEQGEIYTPEKHFKVRVYRITLVNLHNEIHEFSPREVQIYCNEHGLVPVDEYYYGLAKDLYPDLYQYCNGYPMYPDNWYDLFLDRLANDRHFYMELDSPDCVNKVPHEGIVIKIDNMRSFAMKLKSFKFLNKEQKELDAGEANMEDDN